jgi:hypothetical protein
MISPTDDGSNTSSKKGETFTSEEQGLRKRRKSCAKASKKKSSGSGRKEKLNQNDVALALSRKGSTVFRNNVGVAFHRDGSVVVYGLCPGSSDLIGWTPVEITQEMVGRVFAVFTAVEVKRTHGGVISGKQRTFTDNVIAAGGFAMFARSPEDVSQIDEQILKPVSPARVRGLKAFECLPQEVAGEPNDDAGKGA